MENEDQIMKEQQISDNSESICDIPLLRYSADRAADPAKCCFMRDRTASMIRHFNNERIRNGAYAAQSNGIPFQVKGIITYDWQHSSEGTTFLDVVTKVKTGYGELSVYDEITESWWTNYHDESDSTEETVPVDPETWDKEGWFSDPKWTSQSQSPKIEGSLPVPDTDSIPYDALYYEGYNGQNIFILYLRRCTEGYRLLKIYQESTEEPVEISFNETDIQDLYQRVSDQQNVIMFKDFLLNDQECEKIIAYAECDKYPEKLPGLVRYSYANPDRFVSFIRKSGADETEVYSISSLMIKGLTLMRVKYGDY